MQGLLVQKYGGSSLATAERIRAAARRVARTAARGKPVIVVVSAMGDTTDELIELAYSVAQRPPERELDLLLSTGETVSATLMAMALHDLQQPAVALTGLQAGIRSTRVFSRARITDIQPARISTELLHGKVVIVTGFQGVTEDQDVTTLGRGGSDTTAVALACALGAERCDIYTDVEGIYTADPRVVPSARKLSEVGYEEMLELAQLGARVMHPRAVELAELYSMPILVASSFTDTPGTLIHRDGDSKNTMPMEVRKNVRGIAHDTDVARITLVRVPDRPGVAAAIFEPLAAASVSVDTIAQSSGADGTTDLSFTISRSDLPRALEITQSVAPSIHAASVDTADDLAKVSIVGTGMQSAPGYAARMFGALARAGVNINIISTSDIRITCVVSRDHVEDAVRVLHTAFELDRED
ncbi:MAG: aspartate kinase [Chloroflexi bacterium]|nr:aspartate kinase [Chloroflexota bacterium]MBV9895864.1 aspartate kinase [Chloroflexota bacterium]